MAETRAADGRPLRSTTGRLPPLRALDCGEGADLEHLHPGPAHGSSRQGNGGADREHLKTIHVSLDLQNSMASS